ncbi:hypothetical protein JCM14467A_16240 [Vulcanisaeta sp. JCM 14467]
MMGDERNILRNGLVIIGAIILGIGAYLLYGALVMVNYMAYYHCMGMMCGMMVYYPLFLPVVLIVIGAVMIIIPMALISTKPQGLGQPRQFTSAENTTVSDTNDYYGRVLKLLPKAEREVLEYVIRSGGEVFQYQIMRDLGLSKVQAWRIVRRLEEKGLVEVTKVKGRNIVRLKDLSKAGQ